MNRSEPSWCRWSDSVLARHLDGELADDDADHPLDAHLQACQRCQQALRRARRLDALLAQESGEFQHERLRNDQLEARWFAAVAATAHEQAAAAALPAPAGRGRLRRWLAVTVAGAAALLGWFLLRPEPVPAAPSLDEHGPAPVASVAPVPPPRVAPIGPAATNDPASALPPCEARAVALDLRQLQHWGAQPSATSNRSNRTAAAPAANLAGATGHAAPDSVAPRDLIARLQDRDSSVLEPSFLRSALASNHADVDDALRRRMRRHPGSLGLVAAAAREASPRGNAARLLLELWEDTAVRSNGTDDGMLAQQLFAGQSPATFRELGQLAAARGHTVRQHRCWLALGWSHDLDPTPDLLAAVHGPSREASVVAAFALSCQPWQRLLPLARTAGAPSGFLVRAAFWRHGAPELAAALTDWPLSSELQQQLRACSFPTFTQLVDGLRHDAVAVAE